MAGQTTNYLFDYPTSTDYVKDGATAIQTLATDVDTTLFTALGGAYPGLTRIKTQTIGTTVASVTITSAFNATFDSYKIVLSNVTMSSTAASTSIYLRMHDGTNPAITNYNYGIPRVDLAAGTVSSFVSALGSTGILIGTGSGDKFSTTCDVLNPFIASHTIFNNLNVSQVSTGYSGAGAGMHQTSTSYSVFDIRPSTGTLTGGTIAVYGYGKS